jgi:hypothetical protein
VRQALEVGGDNELRVERTVAAYFEFVTSEGAAFRMVFESDLTSVPQVRSRLDAVEMNCAEAIAEVIAEDTGLSEEQSRLLAVSLVGMAQVSARFWLTEAGGIERGDAAALVAGLAWRGIRGYPRNDEQHRLAADQQEE